MNGLTAYKYYQALKQHFTTPKYDVFEHKGRVKCSPEKFQQRRDKYLFEKMANKYTDKDFIQYVASNFMYGTADMIYDEDTGKDNYKEFVKRKQSITKIFIDDLQTIVDSGVDYTPINILKLYLGKKITLETMVILDDMDDLLNKVKDSNMALMVGDDILRIEKSRKFVKYDSYKIVPPYMEFLEDVKRG